MQSTDTLFAFRCQRCFQPNVIPTDQQNQEVICRHCETANTAPEATEQRMKLALELIENQVAQAQSISFVAAVPSDGEISAIIDAQPQVSQSEMRYDSYPNAERIYRLIAVLIDGFFSACALVAGFFAMLGAASAGLVPNLDNFVKDGFPWQATMIFYFIPLMWWIFQWNLIATCGQSVGKKLLGLRIVQLDGRVPGFFSGVILRDWVRVALCFIPFFGLLDIVFIFGDSRRCIHDMIANTRVIQSF